jgi:hypothetical protein
VAKHSALHPNGKGSNHATDTGRQKMAKKFMQEILSDVVEMSQQISTY